MRYSGQQSVAVPYVERSAVGSSWASFLQCC